VRSSDGSEVLTESFYFESEQDPSNQSFQQSKMAFLGGNSCFVDMFNFIVNVAGRHAANITRNDISRIYFDFARQYHELKLSCEKTPSNVLFVRRIFQMSRRAFILFLVRHPASVFASMLRRAALENSTPPWLNTKPCDFAWFYKHYVNRYYEMNQRYGSRIQLLKFEELCDDAGRLLEVAENAFGGSIFPNAPYSRFQPGRSNVKCLETQGQGYFLAQEQILPSTLEYLGYCRLPADC
jgi:Sulfotransferase family